MTEPHDIEDTETDEPVRRSGRRRVARVAVSVLASLVALVIAALLVLDTGPGHRFVANQVRGLEFENGMRIEIGRIGGSLYSKMVLHDLRVRDVEDEFLFSPEVHVDWRPFAYLFGHVDIRSATAERMVLRHLPALREVPDTGEPLLPDIDIDVGKLAIDRFIAEAPVAGERRFATIGGTAHIADGRAQVKLDMHTLGEQGGAGGDRLALDLDAVPEENRLKIALGLQAPKDGVIAAMAGVKRPLALEVTGSGDWAAWNGTMSARSGKQVVARLNLTARDGTFAAKGSAGVGTLFGGAAGRLLGPGTRIDLAAGLDERRADMSGFVASDAFRLDMNGLIDFSKNSVKDLRLDLLFPKPSALAENLRVSGMGATLTLDGAFASPRIRYAVSADRIDGFDEVAGGKLANVRIDGDIAIEGPRILSDNIRIRSDRIDATAVLLVNRETGLYSGTIDGRVDDYRLVSVGIFSVDSNAKLESRRSGGFALEGRVGARSTSLLNGMLRDFLGGNFAAASDVRYSSDGSLNLSNLRLEAPDLHVEGGQASYSTDGRIALIADGISDRHGKIGVRVAGTIRDPEATITAERPDLGIGLANLDAKVLGVQDGYRFDVTSDSDYGPLRADVTLATRGGSAITINSAELSGVGFAGSLQQTPAGPFAGRLTAKGNGLGGVVRLQAEGRYQRADFNIRANDTVFDGPARLAIGSAIIDGRAILRDRLDLAADMQLADTRFGNFNLAAGRIRIDYREGRGRVGALVEGTRAVPFRLAANASLEPGLWRVMLDGKSRGIALRTPSAARIVPGDDGYELLPTRIDIGSGNIKLAGHFGDAIKLQGRFEAVNVALLNAFLPGVGIGGKATGSLDFVQASPTAFPRADARLRLDNFTRTTAASVSEPVDVNFVGKLLADGGEARAVFRQRGSVIGRMAATLRPLPPAAGPWQERLMGAPLSGGVRYNGPAETVFSFAGQPGQNLSGSLGIAADFSCRVQDPCLTGVVRGNDLTYVNEKYGTRLRNLDLSGKFGGNRLEIERLKADAGKGTVTGSGYIGLASDAGYPMDIALKLDQARLARSEAISTSATGDLRLTKSAGETALLSGRIRLPETRYKIIREGAAEVPRLAGVRFKPAMGRKRVTGEELAEPITAALDLVRLDVEVVAPERLYVSGMGLESEWSADFRVTGTSAEPRLAGHVRAIRGTLGFAGRSFELTEGNITFTGAQPADPQIRIVASEDIEDVAVKVNVTGRSSNPQIAFTSTPSLPQDEIVSRILFGSSIANLSPLQAVQLATSLNSLRATGGGLDPLGKLRSATGVDRLRIVGADEEAGRGTAVAAGRYLTDDIYVELITDTRGFTATQLEVSITSWLSVLSQTGGSGASSASVRIKKDY